MTEDNQRQSILRSLIGHGKLHGYLIRADATAMLPIQLFTEAQRDDVLEMISDMGIPVVNERPTGAEQPLRIAPESVVSPPPVGHPIGPVIVVLRVGAEGGEITLIAQEFATGWRYRRTTLDQTNLWLNEVGSETRHQSEWVYEWDDALGALDTYPWAHFRPLAVHPKFAERVLEAARERLTEDNSSLSPGQRFADWSALCRC